MQKIFGIGLSKTGTTSLNEAMRLLGYSAIHFPFHMLKLKNNELSLNYKKLSKYDVITDTPAARFYKELDTMFPNSKFILTIRDKEGWLDSCRRHWWFGKFWKGKSAINKLQLDLYDAIDFDRGKFSEAYDKHIADVKGYFKGREDDLLIMNVCTGDNWKVLCNFLKKAVPDKPFPRANVGFHKLMNSVLKKLSIKKLFSVK